MKQQKTLLTLALLASAVITGTAQAAASEVATPCVKSDLTGTWTAVINDTASNGTERCKMVVNSAGKFTSGSCVDIQKKVTYKLKSGSTTINNQCNVSFTINFNNGVVSKSVATISRDRNTIIGTHTNNLGNFGTLSAIKYGASSPAGLPRKAGDMQYWNGTAWTIIPAPLSAPVAPLMATLHLCNGIPSWEDSCVAPVVPTPPPVNPPPSNATVFNIGDNGPAGGKVFYVTDAGLHGLEAAPADQASSAAWGCYGRNTYSTYSAYIDSDYKPVPGAQGTAVGTGAANTAAIVATCSEANTAAKKADTYALNGYTDWYLPSTDELDLLYQQKTVMGGLTDDGSYNYYWSSTDGSFSEVAWSQSFDNGNQDGTNRKYNTHRVRAIRSF